MKSCYRKLSTSVKMGGEIELFIVLRLDAVEIKAIRGIKAFVCVNLAEL